MGIPGQLLYDSGCAYKVQGKNSEYRVKDTFAYFSPSWTAFQAEHGRDFSVIVDGISN